MGLFRTNTLEKLVETESKLYSLIEKVSKLYNVSSEDTSFYKANCKSAIGNVVSKLDAKVKFGKNKLFSFLLDTLSNDVKQIEGVKDEDVAKSMLNFLCAFFFSRLSSFDGGKNDLYEMLKNYQYKFDECVSLVQQMNTKSHFLRSQEEKMIKLRTEYEQLEKETLKKNVDKIRNDERKKQIERETAKYLRRRSDSARDIANIVDLIEKKINDYCDTVVSSDDNYRENIDLTKREAQRNKELDALYEELEQSGNEAYGNGKALYENNKQDAKQFDDACLEDRIENVIKTRTILSANDNTFVELVTKALEKANIATKDDVKESEQNIKSHLDNRVEELKQKIDDASKLTIEQLTDQLSSLYKDTKEESGLPSDDCLPITIALQEKDLPIERIVASLVNANPPLFIGAASYLRCLLDSYLKYVKGIDTNKDQHIFRQDGTKALIFKAFSPQHNQRVYDMNNELNGFIHNTAANMLKSEEDKKVELISYAKFFHEELKIEFTRIDFVRGVKRLYEKELGDINILASGKYDYSNLFLTVKRNKGENDTDYAKRRIDSSYDNAIGRLNVFKDYLIACGVEDSYFSGLGNPSDKTKIVLPEINGR